MDCKHRIAARELCRQYRELKAAAARGERVRPSTALLSAIRWPEKPKASEPTGCKECGAATKHDLCANCLLIGQVAA